MADIILDATAVASSSITSNLDALQPIYSENLFNDSNKFTKIYDANNNISITNSNGIGPSLATDAATVTVNDSSNWVFVCQSIANFIGQPGHVVSYSVFIKLISDLSGNFQIFAGGTQSVGGKYYTFNVSNKIVSFVSADSGGSASVIKFPNDWFRLIMTHTIPSVGTSLKADNLTLGHGLVYVKNTLNTTAGSQFLLYGLSGWMGSNYNELIVTTTVPKTKFGAIPKTAKAMLSDAATRIANYVPHSDLKTGTDGYWGAPAYGYDLGINYAESCPDGTHGVREISVASGGNYRLNSDWTNKGIAREYSGRVWLKTKSGTINSGNIQINDEVCINFSAQPITTTWQEYTFNKTSATRGHRFIDLELPAAAANKIIHIWGAQLCDGPLLPYARSISNNVSSFNVQSNFTKSNLVTSRDLEVKEKGNLLKYSHTFTNGIWTYQQTNGPTHGVSDPFGGNNAVFLNTLHQYSNIKQNINVSCAGKTYTVSFFAKVRNNSNNGGIHDITVTAFSPLTSSDLWFSITTSTGVISGIDARWTAIKTTKTPAPKGWSRYSVTLTDIQSPTLSILAIWPKTYDGTPRTDSSGYEIYGVQFEEGHLSDYQATTDTIVTSNLIKNSTSPLIAELSDLWHPKDANLIRYSEDYTQSAWGKYNISVQSNVLVAPDGTLTADKLVPNTVSATHEISCSVLGGSVQKGKSYTVSFYIKPIELTQISFSMAFPRVIDDQFINDIPNSPYATNVGDGWYRIVFSGVASDNFNNSGTSSIYITALKSGSKTFIGNDSDGFGLWGVQVSYGATVPQYVKTENYRITHCSSRSYSNFDILNNLNPPVEFDFYKALDPRLSFARGSVATYINNRGECVDAAINQPRFEYKNGVPVGMLMEIASTNLCKNGECLGTVNGVIGSGGTIPSTWSTWQMPAGLTFTIVGSGTEKGVGYFDLRINGIKSGNNPLIMFGWVSSPNPNPSKKYTISAWLKLISGNCPIVSFGFGGGTGGFDQVGTITAISHEFTRYHGTGTTGDSVPGGLAPWLHISTLNDVPYDFTIRIGGVQVEEAATVSSYIRTTGAGAVTRYNEDCWVTDPSFFNPATGAAYIHFDSTYQTGELPKPIISYSATGAGAQSEFIVIREPTIIGTYNGYSEVNNTNGAADIRTGAKAAVSFDTNGIKISLNGQTPSHNQTQTFSTYGGRALLSPFKLGIGSYANSTRVINGHIKKVAFYNRPLSSTQLMQLTSTSLNDNVSRSSLSESYVDCSPVLKTNLLTYSEKFNTYWSYGAGGNRALVYDNQAIAPDGSYTAAKVVAETVDNSHRIYKTFLYGNGVFTFSLYVKAGEENGCYFNIEEAGAPWKSITVRWYNFNNVTPDYISKDNSDFKTLSTTNTDAGNGWRRISITFLNNSIWSPGSVNFILWMTRSGVTNWLGDGTSGFYIWGAQLTRGQEVEQYVKTNGTGVSKFGSGIDLYKAQMDDLFLSKPPKMFVDFMTGTLDNRLSFERTDSTQCATRINSRGLIETVPANTLRFDYDPVTLKCRGILIEESRKNYLTYSNDFTNTGVWHFYGKTYTLTPSTGPDGIVGSSTIITNTDIGTMYVYRPWDAAYTNPSGTTYTISGYAKNNSQFSTISCAGVSQVAYVAGSSVITHVGGGWYRHSASYTTNADNGIVSIQVLVPQGSSVEVYGLQVEVGAFATSYIPTTSSQVTRAADKLYVTGSNFTNIWNKGNGTFTIEYENDVKINAGLIQASSGNGGWAFWMSKYSTTGSQMTISNKGIYANATSVNQLSQNVHRSYGAWRTDGKIYSSIDGQTVSSGSFSNGIPEVSSTGNYGLRIGTDNLVAGWANGHIRNFAYYDYFVEPSKFGQNISNVTTPSFIGSMTQSTCSSELTDLIPGNHNLLVNSGFKGSYNTGSSTTNNLPQGWTLNHSNPFNGITIFGKPGVYEGVEGVYLTYTGTCITSNNEFAFRTEYPIPVTVNTKLTLGVKAAVVSGTLTKPLWLLMIERKGSMAGLPGGTNTSVTLTSSLSHYSLSYTCVNNLVEYFGFKFNFYFDAGEVVNFTIFLAEPQLNFGLSVLPYTPTNISTYSYGALSNYQKYLKQELTDLQPAEHNKTVSMVWPGTSGAANVILKRSQEPDPFGNYDAFNATATGVSNSYINSPHIHTWKRNVPYVRSVYLKKGSGTRSRIIFEEFYSNVGDLTFDVKNLTVSSHDPNKHSAFQDVGGGWYRAVAVFTITNPSSITNSATLYIDNYGVGAPGNDINFYGHMIHEAKDISHAPSWETFNGSTGISMNTSSKTISFDGSQIPYSGVNISTIKPMGKKSYIIRFDLVRSAGSGQVRIGGNNSFYVSTSGTHVFIMNTEENETPKAICQAGPGFIGTFSNISVIELNDVNKDLKNGLNWGSPSTIRIGKTNAFSDDLMGNLNVPFNITGKDLITAILLKINASAASATSADIVTEIIMGGLIKNDPSFDTELTAYIEMISEIYSRVEASTPYLTTRVALNGGSQLVLLTDFISDVSIETKILLQAEGIVNNTFTELDLTEFTMVASKYLKIVLDSRNNTITK